MLSEPEGNRPQPNLEPPRLQLNELTLYQKLMAVVLGGMCGMMTAIAFFAVVDHFFPGQRQKRGDIENVVR